MVKIRVSRTQQVPDALRVSRYRKIPEPGPRILFFSGGTALNGLCRQLKDYTHNSVHLMTPFDSGGSSAQLRRAFDMPAIGDLRSRLMALADETVLGNPEVYRLFARRLPDNWSQKALRRSLEAMVLGQDEAVASIPSPMRLLVCNQLQHFQARMPEDFDLRGASIGNLILAGGYLSNDRDLEVTIFLFSKLVNVHGTVRAVVDDRLHLGAVLADGSEVIGQHRLTGKEVTPLDAPIAELFLTSSLTERIPAQAPLKKKNRKFIEEAELICYPPGSFYSSLIANLIPGGVGRAIAENDCPKVYIPNLGTDPEQLGMDFRQLVDTLLARLHADPADNQCNSRYLNYLLLDSNNGRYPSRPPIEYLRELGIELVDLRLVSEQSAPYYDNKLLADALLSLA